MKNKGLKISSISRYSRQHFQLSGFGNLMNEQKSISEKDGI